MTIFALYLKTSYLGYKKEGNNYQKIDSNSSSIGG
jgi:hypothetical protein